MTFDTRGVPVLPGFYRPVFVIIVCVCVCMTYLILSYVGPTENISKFPVVTTSSLDVTYIYLGSIGVLLGGLIVGIMFLFFCWILFNDEVLQGGVVNILKLLIGFIYNITFKFNHNRGSVLIINDGALGDYIHGLPFAYCLKNLGYDITMFSKETNKINANFKFSSDFNYIKTQKFNMIFALNYKKEHLLYLFLKNTFDFNAHRARAKIFKKWEETHWSDYYLQCLSNFIKKQIYFKNDDRIVNKKYIVFHPGSSNPEKNWDIENFISVYKKISYPDKIFVLGPSELYLERTLQKNGCNYMISTNFEALDDLAKNTRLFVGSDSGVSHFFSTYNCKIISIFSVGCADTHFPYTRNGYFYFERPAFEKFYKKRIITQISLAPQTLLKQIKNIESNNDVLESGFYRSRDFTKYVI